MLQVRRPCELLVALRFWHALFKFSKKLFSPRSMIDKIIFSTSFGHLLKLSYFEVRLALLNSDNVESKEYHNFLQ